MIHVSDGLLQIRDKNGNLILQAQPVGGRFTISLFDRRKAVCCDLSSEQSRALADFTATATDEMEEREEVPVL